MIKCKKNKDAVKGKETNVLHGECKNLKIVAQMIIDDDDDKSL